MSAHGRIEFLGLGFDAGTTDGAVREILDRADHPFSYVVTPNVHHIVKMHEVGDALRSKYAAAWKVYCDSRVLSRLARICGIDLPVVTGSDLTAALVARASEAGLRVAIVGPSAADCADLARLYPGLDIVSHTPPMGFIASEVEIQKCVDFVLDSEASLIFLAVGMPQQEILAQRVAERPAAKGVGLCIGASIDFLTRKQHRAPHWIQRSGLEWLHRLLSDPRRLARRYLVECPRIFPLVIAHVFEARQR